VGSLAIAQVPLAIHVRDAYDQHHSEHTTATAQLFQTIFASYAHEDSEVVKACAEVYRALGITMLIDRDSLRSGERWYPELRRFVQEADLFQLFWSSASSNSTYVAEEWRQALSLLGLKGERFIRPLYWEDPLPPPPNELSQFHFAFLDRKALAQIPQSRSPRPRSPLPLATLDPDDLDPDDLVW
jgi:hypothetical protein